MQSKSTPVIYAVELTKSYGDSLGISLDGKEPKITFGHWTIFDSLSLSLSLSLSGSEHPGQPIVISKIREGGVAHRLVGVVIIRDNSAFFQLEPEQSKLVIG